MKGTLLNTATVAVGSLIGLAVGKAIPEAYQTAALGALGLVTMGTGIKLFLGSKNILVVAAALVIGGSIGLLLGLENGLAAFSEFARQRLGGGGTFNEGLISASILFCIGPMTLLGCIQDGLEGKSELLALKSTMDGFAAIFFAASLGVGVLVSAVVVLVFQGLLTLMARPLKPIADDPDLIAEMAATGGIMLMAIGLKLLSIKALPVANYLPALFLAPLLVVVARRVTAKTRKAAA